jgi:hypothetical protein
MCGKDSFDILNDCNLKPKPFSIGGRKQTANKCLFTVVSIQVLIELPSEILTGSP